MTIGLINMYQGTAEVLKQISGAYNIPCEVLDIHTSTALPATVLLSQDLSFKDVSRITDRNPETKFYVLNDSYMDPKQAEAIKKKGVKILPAEFDCIDELLKNIKISEN